MPQAEVADLVKALGQNMLEIATQELVPRDPANPGPASLPVAVLEADGFVIQADDAPVGQGDAEDVAGQIVEHGLLPHTPGGNMHDPGRAPDGGGKAHPGAALLEHRPEPTAHLAGQRLGRHQKAGAGRMPGVTVLAQAAAGDQAMDMRVEVKLLGPGVQDGQHADRAANMAGVAGQLGDRLARRRHQRAIAVALMTAQGGAQLLGHGDGDVEVGARQHLGLTLVQPDPGLFAMAFRAAPVATGMAAMDLGAARGAALEVSAQGFGPAGQDVGDGAPMRGRHRRAMGRLVAGSEAAEDVRDVDHAGALQAAHQGIEQVAQAGPGRLGQVGVDRRGRDVLMTEQNLDDAGIDAVLQQPGGIAVAQGMGVGRRGSSSPAVRAAAAKVLTRTPVLSGAVPVLLGNSQRGWR